MATILIPGGSGLIGRSLAPLLRQEGYEVIIMSRGSKKSHKVHENLFAHWDPAGQTIDEGAVKKSDYIINLAGAGVADKRWSESWKTEIVNSRVKSGQLIAKALREIPNNVKAVINASGIGWYGNDPVNSPTFEGFREDAPPDEEFLGQTCRKWEASIDPVSELGIRLVKLRTGIVLTNAGGAIKEFKLPIRFGIAPVLATGRQIMSWLHMEDICRMYLFAIRNEHMQGVYNAVSPQPVTNKVLITSLASSLRGKWFLTFPVPSILLKIIVGEVSIEVLKSTRVNCDKILNAGYVYRYPDLTGALKDLARK